MKIRAIKECEWKTVRALRIASLEDAPLSFSETVMEAESRPNEYWIDLTRSLINPHMMLVAESESTTFGSVYGIKDENNLHAGRIGGMWVSSEYRSQGIGSSLLVSVLQWCREQNFNTIGLWVPTNNPPAQSLYTNAGFVKNGRSKIVGERKFEIAEMMLSLDNNTSR